MKAKTPELMRDALGSPVMASFSDELRVTKRNLVLLSAIVIFMQLSGMSIGTGELSFIGLSFSNPGQFWLDVMLTASVLYLFVQFVWQAPDFLGHSRIRVTGTRLEQVTVG